ncbi:MAG: hypothetical protein OEY34_08880, partial [Cyclobacteriaceae bacterium]|nr:hypothetical protein [Cyclobacteriaceae bacterium]
MKLSSKVKLTMVSLGFVCLNLTAQSQTFSEGAFLFSQTNNIGSARTMGLGGAQVSLGGDISLAYSNPAGLGMSNRSFYTFSGGFVGLENIATYENNPIPGNSTVVNIPQLGVAFHKPGTDNSQNSFKGGTFAISYNQTNNFRQEIAYGGNGNSSIVDFLLNRADGVLESDLMSDGDYFNDIIGLAYDVYLIDPEYYYEPTIPDGYYVSIAITPEFPYQTEFITNKGSQREWDFSYGANFDDKIFIGFGLGFSSFKYSSTKVYE